MNSFYVYAIKSNYDGRIYVGFSIDVLNRLKQHNAKKNRSTKAYTPWFLIYFEKVADRIEARRIEKYYKSGVGKQFLKSLPYGPVVQRIE